MELCVALTQSKKMLAESIIWVTLNGIPPLEHSWAEPSVATVKQRQTKSTVGSAQNHARMEKSRYKPTYIKGTDLQYSQIKFNICASSSANKSQVRTLNGSVDVFGGVDPNILSHCQCSQIMRSSRI